MATAVSDLTTEHLGQYATVADLDEYRAMVTTVAERLNIDEDEANELVWGEGDYMRNYTRLMAS